MKLNRYVPGKSGGYLLTGFVLLFFVSLLSSCLKSSNDDYNPGQSNLMIVNAYPSTAGISFWYNGTLVNATPFVYSTNTGYYQVAGGARIEFAKGSGSTQADFLAGGYSMNDGKSYSIFVAGKPDSTFQVRDDLVTAEAAKVAIRFVNASKSAGAVDVKINNTASFSNIAFQKNSDFKQFDGPVAENSKISISVSVLATGTSTEIAAANLSLEKGKAYTIYTRGIKDSQEPSKVLGIGVVDHTKQSN